MGYLLTEIVIYLVIAGLIGFVFGWAAKSGELDKFCSKIQEACKAYYLTLTTTKKVVKETKEDVKETVEEVTSEKVAEVIKEEVKTEETKEAEIEIPAPVETVESTDSLKPILLASAPTEGQDKLSTLKGLGPVMEKKLNELGVYTFEQIASWTSEQELWIGTELSSPKKVTKEEWVKQAKDLLTAK